LSDRLIAPNVDVRYEIECLPTICIDELYKTHQFVEASHLSYFRKTTESINARGIEVCGELSIDSEVASVSTNDHKLLAAGGVRASNDRYKIVAIDELFIRLANSIKTRMVERKYFKQLYTPVFCMTTHAAIGLDLKDVLYIHDLDSNNIDALWFRTAITRCTGSEIYRVVPSTCKPVFVPQPVLVSRMNPKRFELYNGKAFKRVLMSKKGKPAAESMLSVYSNDDLQDLHIVRDAAAYTYTASYDITDDMCVGDKHEYIHEGARKLIIDFDGTVEEFGDVDVVCTIRNAVYAELCASYPDIYGLLPEDLYAYSSCGTPDMTTEEDRNKISYHFALQMYYMSNHHEANAFMVRACKRMPTSFTSRPGAGIDMTIYTKSHGLRLLGATKTGSQRTKRACSGTPDVLSASLMFADFLDMMGELPKRCHYVDVEENDLISDAKVAALLKLPEVIRMMGNAFTYRDYTGVFLNFDRECGTPQFCSICNRIHDNDNTLYIQVLDDGGLVEKCRHKE
jgi:hypothetical protein